MYQTYSSRPDPNRKGKTQLPLEPSFKPDWTSDEGKKWPGNSFNHETEVQNVLFADSHVKKFNTPCIGVDQDNIYSCWGVEEASATVYDKQIGFWVGTSACKNDSYLGN